MSQEHHRVAPLVRVLVTGVGGRSVGHQIMIALRQAKAPYWIVATDANRFSFGLYTADARFLVPAASEADYVPAILRIVAAERVQAILPGTEDELRVLAGARARIESAGCSLIASSASTIDLCLNKSRLYAWLEANGHGTPRWADADRWRELVARVGFPIVGKPAEESGGSRGVAILADEGEVEAFIAGAARSSTRLVLQEYVGSPESEFTVGVLIDDDGAVIDSIVMRRALVGLSLGINRVIAGKGYAVSTGYSQGFIETHPRVAQACEDVAVRLGIRGPVNIQLRLDGDVVKIFEVHPRFSGTASIRAECGFNEPDVVLRHRLFGETFGRLPYRRDVAAIRAFQSVIVPVSAMTGVERPRDSDA